MSRLPGTKLPKSSHVSAGRSRPATCEDSLVSAGISSSARVRAYDRANIPPSESAMTPRTAHDMVADLHALLRAADESSLYIWSASLSVGW